MKKFLLYLLPLVLLCACDDEKAPIDADENFITEFSLSKDDVVYDAVINEYAIVMTVPYNVSLDGAKASVVYTPSAKLYPNPGEITDWNEERIFRVVSYNGDERQYKYTVVKAEIQEEGDVILKNSADIAAFAEKGISVINGNLTIGTTNGDEIKNLSGLENLKEVTGIVTILNSYKGTDLTGLDNLRAIGGFSLGTSEQCSNVPLYLFSLNSLESVSGNIDIYTNSLELVDFKNLPTIDGSVNITSSNLKSVTADKLTNVNGDFIVSCKNEKIAGGAIKEFCLPELVTIGGVLSGKDFAELETISFPKLETAGGLVFEEVPFSLSKIIFPEIKEINGDMIFTSYTTYQVIGAVTTGNTNLRNFTGFDHLNSVKGTIKIDYFTELEEIPNIQNARVNNVHLNHLDKIHVLHLDNTEFYSNGDNISEFEVTYMSLEKIIGHSKMSCDFVLTLDEYTKPFPVFQNIEEIDGLYFKTVNEGDYLEIEIPLKRINQNLQIDPRSRAGGFIFRAPNLSYVGGYVFIRNFFWTQDVFMPSLGYVGSQLYLEYVNNYDFSSLKNVCANNPSNDFKYELYTECEDFKTGMGMYLMTLQGNPIILQSLEAVGGSGVKFDFEPWLGPITRLSCPKLQSIEGKLWLYSQSDQGLSTLDLPILKNVDSIEISNLQALYNFDTFGQLFVDGVINKSDQWSVQGCGYNPSFEDMKSGKYKPSESSMRN